MEQAANADEAGDCKTVFDRRESKLYSLVAADLDLIHEILIDDSKNYHAWQYRRWLVDFFAIPSENELEFCNLMLTNDRLNNSAWNHRFYTIAHEGFMDEVFDRVRSAVFYFYTPLILIIHC